VFIAIAAVSFALARYALAAGNEEDEEHTPAPASRVNRDRGDSSMAQPLAIELRAADSQSDVRRAIAETIATRGAALGVRLPDATFVDAPQTEGPAWRIRIFDDVVATGATFSLEDLQRELDAVLLRHAERYVGVQEVSELLDTAAEQYPVLVKEVLRQVPVQRVAEVVRNLLREGIPVRSLRDVLEALNEWSGREKDTGNLTEFVRMHLKRYMTSRFADASRQIKALVVDGRTEELVRKSLTETPAGMMLTLPRQKVTELRDSLRSALNQPTAHAQSSLVLITSVDLRRHLRQILEPIRPSLPVISYQELLPDVEIQPLGTVRFQTESS
jgi:hypothetical protein